MFYVLVVFLGNSEAAFARNFPTWNLASCTCLQFDPVSQVLAFRCTSFSHILHLSGCNLHPPEEEQMARAHRPITSSPAKNCHARVWATQGWLIYELHEVSTVWTFVSWLGNTEKMSNLSNFMSFSFVSRFKLKLITTGWATLGDENGENGSICWKA